MYIKNKYFKIETVPYVSLLIYFHELNQILLTIIWNPTDGTYTIILETLVVMTESVDIFIC